jgi:zinc protease
MTGLVVDTRPTPGQPRHYEFPSFERTRLPNGLTVIVANLPGRPLVSASLVMRSGAGDEPDLWAGATILAARALSEGTEKYDAIALIEATERLGAGLHAEASWDATSASIDVPSERLEAALELLAEMVHNPTFPANEVERLRDERLNDLLQAKADPRRRAEEAFAETIYSSSSPYHRPGGGTDTTVRGLDRDIARSAYERGRDPARSTFLVAGDLTGIDAAAIVERLFGDLRSPADAAPSGPPVAEGPSPVRTGIRLIHRPGSVQTEVRVGHVGVPRRIPDFPALSVTGAILGGLFNSRLNMKLREEKGYTYGASAGWDLRRAPGPFAARAAVNGDATAPALSDMLTELHRIREGRVTDAELDAARDFLVGVFPLRFETPGAVLGALAGLAVHDLPDEEITRYREHIEAVTATDVLDAAQRRIDPDRLSIVLVGDADSVLPELEKLGLGPIAVERDEGPMERAPEEPPEAAHGPVDDESDKVSLPVDDDVADQAGPEGVDDGRQA